MPLLDAIEIGPVHPEELDQMLEIMCEAFEMPFEAARPIFYADPYFDIQKKWVLRVGGEVVSCLTLVETEAWVGDSVLPLVGVAGVATRRALRNRGYAGALLREILRHLRSRRVGLCALVPADSAYYEKFGWAIAGTAQHIRIRREALPYPPQSPRKRGEPHPPAPSPKRRGGDLPEKPPLLPRSGFSGEGVGGEVNSLFPLPSSLPWGGAGSVDAVVEGDIPHLCTLYNACSRGKTLRLLRDERRWRHLLRYVPVARIFRNAQGEPEGYLLARIQPGILQSLTPYTAGGGTLEILEREGISPEANEALMCSVVGMTEIEFVKITCPESDLVGYGLSGDLTAPEACEITTVSAQMTRIVDAEALFEQLAAGWADGVIAWEGTVELVIEDPFAPGGEDRIQIRGSDAGRPVVRRVAEGSAGVEIGACGGVQVWSQLAVGAIGVDQVVAQGRLRLSKPEGSERFAMLFPNREPFLPLPDRF